MNKLIIFPLFLMVMLALVDAIMNPASAIMHDAWIYGLMTLGMAAIGIGGLLLKETALSAVWKDVTVIGVWLMVTGMTLSYFTSAGFLGTVFYIAVTIMFFVGVFVDVDGGGD